MPPPARRSDGEGRRREVARPASRSATTACSLRLRKRARTEWKRPAAKASKTCTAVEILFDPRLIDKAVTAYRASCTFADRVGDDPVIAGERKRGDNSRVRRAVGKL